MKSWYKKPTSLTPEENVYLGLIESVFKVQDAAGKWVPYILQPHQIEFHVNDIAIKGENAISDVVEKSRNTSFTTSAIIRLLTGNFAFHDETVPVVRINDTKAAELIDEIKKIIKNCTPIKLEDGQYWPFDKNKVNLNNSHTITFEDIDVKFVAYPAQSSAAENIRGLRITRGLIDECNFMSRFYDIFIAARDAARGSTAEGRAFFQLTLGTTLKGQTPFYIWLEKLKKLKLLGWRILSWPVFNPLEFDKEKPLFEQPNLVPIVFWHDLAKLEEKRRTDINTFLEEYMAVCGEDSSAFYSLSDVMMCVNEDLQQQYTPTEGAEYMMTADPAGEGGDYFAVTIFEKPSNVQRFLYYKQKADLTEMQNFLDKLMSSWNITKARIDANGLGYQIGQFLKKKYGNRVELFRGAIPVHIDKKQTVPFKEYIHTNLKKMIVNKELSLLPDDMQVSHFGGWNYRYECARNPETGHGDIVIAIGLAMLPSNWKFGGDVSNLASSGTSTPNITPQEFRNNVQARINWYKAQNRKVFK